MQKKIARWISNVFAPPIVGIPVLLTISFGTSHSFLQGLTWGLTTITPFILTIIMLLVGLKLKYFSDLHITNRKERPLFLTIAVSFMVIAAVALLFEHPSRIFLMTMLSGVIAGILGVIITLKWKISWHVGTITGSVIVMVFAFGPWWLLAIPLIFLVGWARLFLHAHSLSQMIAGFFVAGLSFLSVFSISLLFK